MFLLCHDFDSFNGLPVCLLGSPREGTFLLLGSRLLLQGWFLLGVHLLFLVLQGHSILLGDDLLLPVVLGCVGHVVFGCIFLQPKQLFDEVGACRDGRGSWPPPGFLFDPARAHERLPLHFLLD